MTTIQPSSNTIIDLSTISTHELNQIVGAGGEWSGSIFKGPDGRVSGTVTGSVSSGPWTTSGSFGSAGQARIEVNHGTGSNWQVGGWAETTRQTGTAGGITIRRKW